MNPYWSYALGAVGLTGIYLAGKKSRWGWAIGFGSQGIWLTYAVATQQWGFIPVSLGYAWMYAKNFLAWHREAQAAANVAQIGSRTPLPPRSAIPPCPPRPRPYSGGYSGGQPASGMAPPVEHKRRGW